MRKKNEKEKVLLWKYLLMFPTCSWPCIGWNHFPLSATHPFRFIPQDVKVFMATTGPPTTERPWGPQAQATFAGLDSEPAAENWCRHKKSRYLDDVYVYIVYVYIYIYTVCISIYIYTYMYLWVYTWTCNKKDVWHILTLNKHQSWGMNPKQKHENSPGMSEMRKSTPIYG